MGIAKTSFILNGQYSTEPGVCTGVAEAGIRHMDATPPNVADASTDMALGGERPLVVIFLAAVRLPPLPCRGRLLTMEGTTPVGLKHRRPAPTTARKD